MLTRAALVNHARDSIARGSQSFALAAKLFDQPTRERAWLLYAWCRKCDDIADGQEHGGALSNTGDLTARLARIRTLTAQAYRGEATGNPAFDGLGVVARECHIPQYYADDLIAGFALDTAGWRPETTADLLRYCYHVAGVVGKMMALVMGVDAADEATLGHACDLGLAFQLANIARDVREDALAERCYLPVEWLAEVGLLSEDFTRGFKNHPRAELVSASIERQPQPWLTMKWILKRVQNDNMLDSKISSKLAPLGTRLAEMASGYEASARIGARALSFRSRWAVLAAAGIYGDIAREVARRGACAWDTRVVTSKTAKLGWVARALVQAQRSKPAL